MNYRLYPLIFTLTLVASPALQAMRVPRVNSMLMAARAMREPLLRTGNQALMRTQSTHKNDQKEQFNDTAYSAFYSKFLHAAGAAAVGLAMAAQHQMQEERNSQVIEKLDIYDIKAVLEVFKNGTEEDKQELAERVGQKITHYSVDDIIEMLRHATLRPHRILVNAVSKNITHYTTEQISKILKCDTQDQTHDLIASALRRNHVHFIGTQFWDYKDTAINEYAQVIKCLKVRFQERLLAALAQDFNVDKSVASLSASELFAELRKHPAGVQKIIIALFLDGKHNFNKGDMIKALCAHLQDERKVVYELLKQEFQLTDSDWQAIWRIFNQEKSKFIKPGKVDDQILYEVNLSDSVKKLIVDTCKARGIAGQVVVRSMPFEWGWPLKITAAAVNVDRDESAQVNKYVLYMDTWYCALISSNELKHILEHEIGGHIKNDHTLFRAVLGYYLHEHKKFSKDKIKAAVLGNSPLPKLFEYEADLFSAIHDDQVALCCKKYLERGFGIRPALYMSNQEFYRAIMAIIHLKEAAHKWSDGEKAYNNKVRQDMIDLIVANTQ